MSRVRNINRCLAKPSVCPPGSNALVYLRYYWNNVHQIFIRRIWLSAIMLRSCHPLWNASAPNDGGYANFRPDLMPKIGYHSKVLWAIAKRRLDRLWPLIYVPILKVWLSYIIGFQGDRKKIMKERKKMLIFWDNWSPRGPLKQRCWKKENNTSRT